MSPIYYIRRVNALFVGFGASLALVGCEPTPDETDAGAPIPDVSVPDMARPDMATPDMAPADAGLAMDAEPPMADAELHDLTELRVQGNLKLDVNGVGGQITVTARCGDRIVTTMADADGRYALTADVENCPLLVVSFEKESYVPTYRAIPLPPPTSPITLDLGLLRAKALMCGNEECTTGPLDRPVPSDVIRRGWVYYDDGLTAVDQVAGEFEADNGDLLWVTSYSYQEFFDEDGVFLDTVNPDFVQCMRVALGSQPQLVDAVPETAGYIEVEGFEFVPETATWSRLPYYGVVAEERIIIPGQEPDMGAPEPPPEGLPYLYEFEPVPADALPDVQSDQRDKAAWICGNINSSGWRVWGRTISARSCVSVTVTDQCGAGVPNVVTAVTSRDDGYRALRWTDRQGKVCVSAASSEPQGMDYDGDLLGGETHFVDLKLSHPQSSRSFNDLEMPRTEGHCGAPDTCIQLTHEIFDSEKTCP